MPKPNILIVDDEPKILRALVRVLRKEGYRVLTAESGAAGLEVLGNHDVSVVIADYRMPGMSGVDFLLKAKALQYDKLLEKYELSYIHRIDYLGSLFMRLKNEINKRDFSGLPTDKLYFILMDVKDRIEQSTPEDEDDAGFDNFSSFDDLNDFTN